MSAMSSEHSSPAVEIEYLRKVYQGKIEALRGLQLSVPRGSVFGLLGANGAGKSTLIKSLLGIISPTECRGQMLGEEIGRRSVLKQVGYLPENPDFPPYLTGSQVIQFSAGLAKVPRAEARRRSGELLELVGMSDWAGQRIKRYSKGMRQRIGLAQALVNDPKLVFLDEPTDGVDPAGRREIREVVAAMRERGATVFLNSHLLGEVEQMCDRVCILAKGEVVIQGPLEELVQAEPAWLIQIENRPKAALMSKLEAELGLRAEGAETLVVPGRESAKLQQAIDGLRGAGVPIVGIERRRLSLEEVYLSTTRTQTPGANRPSTPPPMPN